MSGPNCHNCIYSVCDPELWLRLMYLGEPILPRCANHPWFPGRLHEVPGTPCPNYRRRPEPPTGDVRMIPLANGSYAYVDAADYEWLSQWNWHTASDGYPARCAKGTTIFMHRQIMQPPKGMVVDHIDGYRANNCRANLRVCTHQENRCNMRKKHGALFRYKGVFYHKHRDKIFAQYCHRGRTHRIGCFENALDAARAYDRAAVEVFGEFARVNFPREWPPERRAEVYALAQEARKKERRKVEKKKPKKRNTGSKRGAEPRKRAGAGKRKARKARGKKIKPPARTVRRGTSARS